MAGHALGICAVRQVHAGMQIDLQNGPALSGHAAPTAATTRTRGATGQQHQTVGHATAPRACEFVGLAAGGLHSRNEFFFDRALAYRLLRRGSGHMQVSKWSRFEKVMAVWALAIASVALLVVLVALGSVVSDNSSNVASWVQAVGAIVAIAAGAAAVNWQVRTQANHAEEARLERVKAVANALFNCRMALVGFLGNTLSWKDATRHADMALWWLRSLESMPLHEFPHYRTQTIVGIVLSEARAFSETYPSYLKINEFGDFKQVVDSQAYAAISKCGAALVTRLEEAECAVEAHLVKHGSASPETSFQIDGKTYKAGRGTAAVKRENGKVVVGFGIQLLVRRQV